MDSFVLHYNYFLVGLSIIIAMLASWTTFDFISRFQDHNSLLKKGWLFVGSVALGIGVWSMHFVGMFACYSLQAAYFDKSRLIDSFLILFVANGLASYFFIRISSERLKLAVVSLFLTLGISGMHYTGMSALQADITYDAVGVLVSILITLSISPLLLWLIKIQHNKQQHQFLLKLGSSAILGIAISAMHYSGMFAMRSATFRPIPDLGSVVYMQSVVAYGVSAFTLFIFCLVLIGMYLDRKHAYRQAELCISQYRPLFDNNPDIVLQLDRTGKITAVNSACKKITGWREQFFRQKSIRDFIPAKEWKKVEKHLGWVGQGEIRNYETVLIGEGERHIHLQVSNVPIKQDDEIVGSYWFATDITERKKAEQTIKHMAYHDSLTGVPNPRMFQKRLQEALAYAKQKQEELAIFFIDLDRFQVINDQFGHIFGDRVIKIVSERLQSCLEEGEMIARLGGDEFAFLLPGVTANSQIIAFSQKIMQQFEQAWMVDEKEFHLTPSMGISVYPHDGEDAVSLAKHADRAMYSAKKMGKNRVHFFSKELEDEGTQPFELENALRKALEQQELTNYYQPKVDIHANQIVGMEALIRWIRPDGTMIPPSEFIPLAEETGLILPIGKQVLRQACLQNKKWLDEGKPPLCVSVNISYVQFSQPDFLDTIKEALAETNLPPQYLELEITEGIAMHDIPMVIQILRELRRIGINISIDDFGTGYSSLAYLSQFPIQALKIDKTFIQGAESNPTNKAIIMAIMAMAKSLGINIIAEGVEKPAQLSFLREHGCHVVQGYYYSPPVPAKKFEEFVTSF